MHYGNVGRRFTMIVLYEVQLREEHRSTLQPPSFAGRPAYAVTALQLAQADHGTYYILHLDAQRRAIGDSWHATLQSAMDHAHEVFGVNGEEWMRTAPR
jgi:Rps23 Pro-64 3,4-dihydroxylase Tpa1-like proline 4-hydroxylase